MLFKCLIIHIRVHIRIHIRIKIFVYLHNARRSLKVDGRNAPAVLVRSISAIFGPPPDRHRTVQKPPSAVGFYSMDNMIQRSICV